MNHGHPKKGKFRKNAERIALTCGLIGKQGVSPAIA
jgi:hypothetical protein